MRAHFINEKFKEESDPIRDMGIGEGNWEVVFNDYGDNEVVVNQKFYTRNEADDYAYNCEYEYQDITIDNDGNDAWKTFTRYHNPEDGEVYFGYNIRERILT